MIFISYRRADTESVVGRIYSELRKHLAADEVFLDHDSIPLGKPFLEVIRERLTSSRCALILIGPQWCSIKNEKTGRRRLDDVDDPVRLEVEMALATPGVDVIPIWVMRATTTAEEIAALPASLQPLFKVNGLSLRPIPDEDSDLQRLLHKLEFALKMQLQASATRFLSHMDVILEHTVACSTQGLRSVEFCSTGSRLLTTTENAAIIVDVRSGERTAHLSGYEGRSLYATFAPDGKRVVTVTGYVFLMCDYNVRVWDSSTGHLLSTLRGHTKDVGTAAFSPNNRVIASSSEDYTTRLWDASSFEEIRILRASTRLAYGSNFGVFSPNSDRVLTSSCDSTAIVWNTVTGERELDLQCGSGSASAGAFLMDGKWIITWSRGTISIWDSTSGRKICTVTGHLGNSAFPARSFSPNGLRFVTIHNKIAVVRETTTGAEVASLVGHSGHVVCAEFGDNGAVLTAAGPKFWGREMLAKVWNANTGRELCSLNGHSGQVEAASFSPDGSRIASVSADGVLKIWRLIK